MTRQLVGLTRFRCFAVLLCAIPLPATAANYSFRDGEAQASCWLPDKIAHVRGVVVAHPMVAGLTEAVAKVAQEEGLGTMVYSGMGDIESLDRILDQWAAASKHPELRGVAILTGGLSASCLAARNAAYAVPERTIAIFNAAGANLHAPRKEPILNIPMQLHVGQFEEFGPDGGIRPHLQLETQWYMLAEDIRIRRSKDADALLSEVVIPGGHHGSWNGELAALFVKKAVQARLPKDDKRDGSTPAKCIPIKNEDGWLTDGEVKYTKFEPASVADYKGDKGKTLWHFDRELAMAVHNFHRKAFGEPGDIEKIWPLGERLPVNLPETRDIKADHAIIRPWIVEKMGRGADHPVPRVIAACVTRDLTLMDRGKDKILRDFGITGAVRHSLGNIFGWYDAVVKPYDKAVTASKLPPEFKNELLKRQMILSVWPLRRSDRHGIVMRMDRPELGIPDEIVNAGSASALAPGRSLRDELTARWPDFAKASPLSQLLVYRTLAGFNPCLDLDGSFAGTPEEAKALKEDCDLPGAQLVDSLYVYDPDMRPKPDARPQIEKVSLPAGKGLEHVFRFVLRPERVFLIPDAKTLAAMANPRKADLKNVWVSDAALLAGLDCEELDLAGCRISDLKPLAALKNLRALRLSENPVKDLSPLKGMPLRSLDLAGTEVVDLAPLSGMPIQSLNIRGTAVASLAPLGGMPLKELDARGIPASDLAPLAGLPLESLVLTVGAKYGNIAAVEKIGTLKTIDGMPTATWIAHHGAVRSQQERDARLAPYPMKESAAAGPGDWPTRNGPNGTGVTTADGDEWIDDMACARRAWACSEPLPSTIRNNPADKDAPAFPPSGGFASPIVADGRVYLAYSVPNGPAVAEEFAEKSPKTGRECWRTDADDVLLCVDAATGRTLWRRVFVEAGYNIGSRTGTFIADMTPCSSDGRVFFLGSRGRVHCADARTGAPLWSSSIGYRAWDYDHIAWMSRNMKTVLRSREDFATPVAVAGGVVGVLDFRYSYYRSEVLGRSSLVGLDAKTGRPLWNTPDVGGQAGVPIAWIRSEGAAQASHFIIGDGEDIHCLRASDGKESWTVPGGTIKSTLATPDLLIGGMPKSFPLTGYSISPDKAEPLKWTQAGTMDMTLPEGFRPAATSAGALYLNYGLKETVKGTNDQPTQIVWPGVAIVDGKTGKVAKKVLTPAWPSAILCAGNQVLLVCGDAATVWKPDGNTPPVHPFNLRIAPGTLPALAGGRIYARTTDGLVCLELRKKHVALTAEETTVCLASLKSDSLSRSADAGIALRNCADAQVAAVLADLLKYVEVDQADAALGAGGKKMVRVKEQPRAVAAAVAVGALVPRQGVAQAERDAVARALGLLLDMGSLDERIGVSMAIGSMGPAGKAAIPLMKKTYANAQPALQEAMLDAARKITASANVSLLPDLDSAGGTGDAQDLGL
jgi:outer membrane protein assembly factor BamB